MTDSAQSPDERFDVLDDDVRPTGITKRRADVHRDGDWHRSIHVWVYGIDDDGPFLLLNQRGRHKDVGALALDPTVGGHLSAGETVDDAFREIVEELGVDIPRDQITFLLQRKRDSADWFPGIRDREVQEAFIARDDRPLREYAPNPAELEGLVKLPLAAAIELFAGHTPRADGVVLRPDGTIDAFAATPEQLLVRGDDSYFIDVARAIARHIPD